jgi:IS605 OrfB family transposase
MDATLQAFADACNVVRSIAESMGIASKFKLQCHVYQELRSRFGLSSNLTIRAIARVAAASKLKHKHPTFRATSVDYDQRIFRFRQKDWTVSLTLLGGAERFKLAIGSYQRSKLTGKIPTCAKLVRRKNGDYYIQIALDVEPIAPARPTGHLGVDLGIKNLASLSTGERFSSAQTETIRNHYQAMRTILQKKGTKGAKRLLKRLSGREKRFMAWVNHTVSARIIRFARYHRLIVVIEDLKGIRQRANWRKAQRHRLHRWNFYQLRSFLEYKALRDGVELVAVKPAYTSKTCHQCLRLGTRHGDSFNCRYCGYSGHADYNGACNISLLGECVTLPEHSLSCRLVEE